MQNLHLYVLSLSIKKAEAPPPRQPREPREQREQSHPKFPQTQAAQKDQSFEDKLKMFMQDSDSRMSGLKNFQEKNRSPRRGWKDK